MLDDFFGIPALECISNPSSSTVKYYQEGLFINPMHDIKAMDNVCDKNVLMLQHKEVNEDAIMLLSAS